MGLLVEDFRYHKAHNFNLLSPSGLIHCLGWKISHADEKVIHVENRKGEVIKFNIVVPTSNGAVYTCRFACSTEVLAASTDMGLTMNINIAHSVLGHRNDDSVQKTT